MANQIMTVTGNIGSTPTFKSADYNLCEIFLVTEEYKSGENGIETRQGSQAAYQVTVWAPRDQPQALEQLRVLKTGMRIEVSGAYKDGIYTKEDTGEQLIGRSISCSPSDIKIKLNRIENITMRAKQNNGQRQNMGQPQFNQDNHDDNYGF
ncbi:hypothetical protein THIAE_06000 [Thiomicrospira aerophila AL3]|uniref:Single-stranded DNA-binding protein n=1 Tax=Thiomicrospira aerophila AL3 TaxID=717772 RepID=W0DYE6_9GAMM|nr:hypothetical protein [Thiomicrospira aerophila]AHF02278.1 hypothetical protein THIAE_06000 [Thiomicrospira aerophila AL3]